MARAHRSYAGICAGKPARIAASSLLDVGLERSAPWRVLPGATATRWSPHRTGHVREGVIHSSYTARRPRTHTNALRPSVRAGSVSFQAVARRVSFWRIVPCASGRVTLAPLGLRPRSYASARAPRVAEECPPRPGRCPPAPHRSLERWSRRRRGRARETRSS